MPMFRPSLIILYLLLAALTLTACNNQPANPPGAEATIAALATSNAALATHRDEAKRIESLVAGIAELSLANGQALTGAAGSARLLEGLAGDLRQAIGKFRLAATG